MGDARVRRWSRRIVHPRLLLTTSDPDATLAALATALADRGFRTRPAGDGFRATRRPWLSWLATAASTSCVLLVETTSPTTVVVDVEHCGDHPAPVRVAQALTDAVRRLTSAGVEVHPGGWQAVP
ncbi:hypothetical protein [Nocardioides pinisoli]|uniref:Uncharacterized protein n=1 Tax=Nocardioides pinisoli TaxID=2950279 RepID=A0ABT1KR25_9ACTN|nr:hypothetical protein [Nocardioides pinisoli]MCP3420195.1 hypothetical protein [Nocardioides pinisoli]